MAAGDKVLLDSASGDFLLLEDDGTGPPPSVTDVALLEAAGGGGGFQVAWAARSTVTIQPGVAA